MGKPTYDDRVKVVADGPYKGQTGRVTALGSNVPKWIGVRIKDTLVWFETHEVESQGGE